MRILYIGETATHEQYMNGNVPSHWFYGAVEMERDGHEVVWSKEGTDLLSDLRAMRQSAPDVIFIPNLNLHNHLLLLLLTAVGILRKPVYAYLHHEPRVKSGIKAKVYKLLLSGVGHVFFLSEKTLDETVGAGLLERNKCSVPGWGPDMNFYGKVGVSDNGWFVSTGKENRDFEILIEAFRRSGAPLHIITARSHGDANYENLTGMCNGIENIKVTVLDNSPANYPGMVREMASAKALVCPLRMERLDYCVGRSTIADAEGLGKPLIITANPYHGRRPELDGFNVVKTADDWVDAIEAIRSSGPQERQIVCDMACAYAHMKNIMRL